MARFESAPSAVHLFAFPTTAEWAKNAASGANHGISPKLKSVLIHSKPVLHAKWNPARRGSLAMCCGSGSMYLWSDEWMGEGGETEEVAECVGVPTDQFNARDIRWSPDGKGLVLVDRETFCCAFEVEGS